MKIKFLDGSGTIELRYVFEDVDRHGNVRIYVRKGRRAPKIRLREPVGTEAFLAEVRRALAGDPAPSKKLATISAKEGTFGGLVSAYYQSAEFGALRDSTKAVRRRILDGLHRKLGSAKCADFEHRHIRKLRDERAANVQADGTAQPTPAAANVLLKILKVLFQWGCEAGLLQSNPARDVRRVPNKTDGHHAWSEAEVKKFEARHPEGSKARLALALLLNTGVRRSDVITLGRQMEHQGAIRFKQTKTDKWLTIPILPALRAEIDRHASKHLTYLVTEYGRPFTAAGFGNWFRDRCDEAGLSECSAHGLRKAGATLAANSGASAHQLKAIFGWSNLDEAETYTRQADQQRLAAAGIHYLERKADK